MTAKTCPRRVLIESWNMLGNGEKRQATRVVMREHQWSAWNPETRRTEEMVVDVKRRWRSKKHPKTEREERVMCVHCGKLKLVEPNNRHRKAWE